MGGEMIPEKGKQEGSAKYSNTADEWPKEPLYPCNECGKLRTKDEGGTTFTVCDECWEKNHPKLKKYCEDCGAEVSDDGYSIDPNKACYYCKLD